MQSALVEYLSKLIENDWKNADPDAHPKRPGFFPLPVAQTCHNPGHNFPSGLYIPPGKGYTHVCPGCGSVSVGMNPGVY